MNIKLFMLSALGFIGLQAAEAGTRVTTHGDTVTVERMAPKYEDNSYSAQPSAPMAFDLSQCSEEQLYQALVTKQQAKEAAETQAFLAAERRKRNLPDTMFRTQGSLPILVPQAGRHYNSAPATPAQSQPVQRLRHEQSSAFDTTDSECDELSPTVHQPKGHRRQRSWSADAAPAQQIPEQTLLAQRCESTLKFNEPTQHASLELLAASINIPFGPVAVTAVTAFRTYEQQVTEKLAAQSSELEKLLTCLHEKQHGTVTPRQASVRLLPERQKAIGDLKRGSEKVAREMTDISAQLAALSKKLTEKTQKLAAKKK